MNNISCNIYSKKYNYKDVISYFLSKFNIDGIRVTVVENEKIVNMFSTKDIDIEAITVRYPGNSFVIYIRPRYANLTIICHEIVHIWQYYRGDLSTDDNKICFWKGERFDNSIPYDRRPWEDEAFGRQNRLAREYKKYIKNKAK